MSKLVIETNEFCQIIMLMKEIKETLLEQHQINKVEKSQKQELNNKKENDTEKKIKTNANTKHTIIIDIETTGIPDRINFNKYYDPAMLKKYDKSRITEIGYIIVNNNNESVYEYSSLIKPNNFEIKPIIDKKTGKLLNDITHDKCIKNGKNIDIVLQKMLGDIKKYNCNLFVSHNVDFDYNIILSECYRNKIYDLIKILEKMKAQCTMKSGKNKYKIGKLEDLHQEIFKHNENEKHRALDDAKMCRDVYVHLKKYYSLSTLSIS
jgi:DNA polymerase III epsilon subunit-like protein